MTNSSNPVVGFVNVTEPSDTASIGGSLHDFLKEEGIYEEVKADAAKAIYALQLEQAIRQRNLTKTVVASAMKTSRGQLDRVLDPANNAVSLALLIRAASLVGKRIEMRLVDE